MGGACSIRRPPADVPVVPDSVGTPRERSTGPTNTSFKRRGITAQDMAKFTAEEQPSARGARKTGGGAPVGELSLTKTLADDEASGAFMAFARADMSEENLQFWFAVKDFREGFAASEADGSAAERAAALVKSYLKAGAEKQVCIGDRRVAPVLEAAERGEVSAEMFDHPQGIAQGTLAQDIFPRFVESPAGQALAARRPELCEGPPAKR
jgi:hypothetical protein